MTFPSVDAILGAFNSGEIHLAEVPDLLMEHTGLMASGEPDSMSPAALKVIQAWMDRNPAK